MSVDVSPVLLERYFYPIQKVESFQNYDAKGPFDGSRTILNRKIEKVKQKENTYLIQIDLMLDKGKSENPPYDFHICIVGFFNINFPSLSDSEKESLVLMQGSQILIGSIREKLANLTTSAPWGVFYLNVVLLTPESNSPPIKKKTLVKKPLKKVTTKKKVKIIK